MITISTAILGAIGGAVGGAICAWIALGAKRLTALTKVIKAIAHDALFSRCEALILKGSITTDELENLNLLFEAYQDMGMNGAGKELYNRAKALPLK